MNACHDSTCRGHAPSAVVHVHRGGPLVALVGNPNCGKTALFNVLTGSRQKVANYAGVTVERKEGRYLTAAGKTLRVLDLPGTYSLNPRSPDEQVTVDVLMGRARGEKRPDRVICVVDATNLRRNLRLVLAVKRLGVPCVVALNMTDLAARRGIHVDVDKLSRELGVPVVKTVAVRKDGAAALRALLDAPAETPHADAVHTPAPESGPPVTVEADHDTVHRILVSLGLDVHAPHTLSDRIDRVVLHPVIGMALLMMVLFLMFQAVFAWAAAPMGWIESATTLVADAVTAALPHGWVRSLIVDGVIAGAGGVLVFLPQILILFFFILVLEESGYLPRAAFMLDRLMGSVGLSGRSFIPLLSCFACAIPGIMAARTIASPRDRLVTIMIAPLMTCSARLPVYALLIGAFIPRRDVAGVFELQGLVLFALYIAGVASAMGIAWLAKRFTTRGLPRPLMMELPTYHWPTLRNVAIGLWQRASIFLRRVGGIILGLTIVMWFLASFPAPPAGATGPAIEYSLAGTLGRSLATIFEPIGFNWEISIALVPGMAAREVAVSALGTVYALSASGDDTARALTPLIAHSWSLATALSLLTWFVFAPQCLSTLATVKRETGGWKMPLVMAGYLFGLAWLACFIVYRLAVAAGWG
ncbi:MAG: ferrous iron transporter B [Thiobacillus sp. 63-78]|uniref:ferrous iron transporter B n=1 Tax=Thiobacillus sp. 63-78 TaxID=1895859 RepID=UPI00086F79F7|nr:ferrous iron transporter B [Thiobacillus sp. 63-78]ODV12302.1 MAG: ferrous iron transporter B [Thiobacillus sp. SCN 64-317]OJZ10995.1 MAG: ferrous iron transporter B [Thiobacillus sp. 63-78]